MSEEKKDIVEVKETLCIPAPPKGGTGKSDDPKVPCCKCAAYQEIISDLNRQMAHAKREFEQITRFAGWAKDHAEAAFKILP